MKTLHSWIARSLHWSGAFVLIFVHCFFPASASGQQLLMSPDAYDVSFSPRGTYASFLNATSVLFELSSLKTRPILLRPTGHLAPVFAPDEAAFATVRAEAFAGGFIGTAIRKHETLSAAMISEFPSALYGTNTADIQDMHWMLDGNSFLCLVPQGARIRRYSAANGSLIAQSQWLDGGSHRLSICHSEHRVVSASEDGRIYVWSLDELSLERTITNQVGFAAFAVISEDGKSIYSGSINDDLRVYSTADWSEIRKVKAKQTGVRELAVDREQTIVLTRGYDGTAKGWAPHDLRHLFTVPVGNTAVTYSQKPPYRIQISPDGSLFATAGFDLQGRLFTIPLTVTSARREGQELKLEWCGGRPPFRLQQRASMSIGDWEDVPGELTSRRLSLPLSKTRFYRIVGQPTAEPASNL